MENVQVTKIVLPEDGVGWPIIAHCVHCRMTVIILSPWARKPEKGDYWQLQGFCFSEDPLTRAQHDIMNIEYPTRPPKHTVLF